MIKINFQKVAEFIALSIYLLSLVTLLHVLGLRPIQKFNIQYILTCVVVGVCYIHYTHSNTGDIRTIWIQYVVLIKPYHIM